MTVRYKKVAKMKDFRLHDTLLAGQGRASIKKPATFVKTKKRSNVTSKVVREGGGIDTKKKLKKKRISSLPLY